MTFDILTGLLLLVVLELAERTIKRPSRMRIYALMILSACGRQVADLAGAKASPVLASVAASVGFGLFILDAIRERKRRRLREARERGRRIGRRIIDNETWASYDGLWTKRAPWVCVNSAPSSNNNRSIK